MADGVDQFQAGLQGHHALGGGGGLHPHIHSPHGSLPHAAPPRTANKKKIIIMIMRIVTMMLMLSVPAHDKLSCVHGKSCLSKGI